MSFRRLSPGARSLLLGIAVWIGAFAWIGAAGSALLTGHGSLCDYPKSCGDVTRGTAWIQIFLAFVGGGAAIGAFHVSLEGGRRARLPRQAVTALVAVAGTCLVAALALAIAG